jgi:hypothetical protein
MVRLCAIISLALALIFEAWSISHGVFTWHLFAILGLLLWCISESWNPVFTAATRRPAP